MFLKSGQDDIGLYITRDVRIADFFVCLTLFNANISAKISFYFLFFIFEGGGEGEGKEKRCILICRHEIMGKRETSRRVHHAPNTVEIFQKRGTLLGIHELTCLAPQSGCHFSFFCASSLSFLLLDSIFITWRWRCLHTQFSDSRARQNVKSMVYMPLAFFFSNTFFS